MTTKTVTTIKVPVKPHVKAFWEHADNLGQGPYQIRKDHWLGELMMSIFSFHPLGHAELPADYTTERTLGYPVIELIPKWKVKTELITDAHLNKIGMALEGMFKLSLVFYARGRMTLLRSEQGAVNQFYEQFGVSILDYDTGAAFKVVNRAKDNVGVGEKKKK